MKLSSDKRAHTVYSDTAPQYLLIQPIDKRELEHINKEIKHIRSLTDNQFIFVAFEVNDWNKELSPWTAPPVFGNKPFGSGADDTLAYIVDMLIPNIINHYSLNRDIPVILGGYSLAGLFALWAGYTSDRFAAVAGVSPSVWFPGWLSFTANHTPAVKSIYLSLGRKEQKSRNTIMATVGDNIQRQFKTLIAQNIDVIFEWNEGNHFTEPDLRTAKGFAVCIDHS